MIEYCYPECTTACVTALSVFKKKYPSYRSVEVAYVHHPHLQLTTDALPLNQSCIVSSNFLHSRSSTRRWFMVRFVGDLFYLCYYVCGGESRISGGEL